MNPAEKKGYDAAVDYFNQRLRGRRPNNPYLEDQNRIPYERGWDRGVMEYVERRKAEDAERERQRKERDAAEAERLANRTLREQLYEARDFDDLKAVLERMLDEREANGD